MSGFLHHNEEGQEGQQKSRGLFGLGGGGSSSSSDEEREEAHAGQAAAGGRQARRKTRSSRQAVKVFSQANPRFSLTVRDDQVVLAPGESYDDNQVWIRDASWGDRVQDDAGNPAFALVSKATGLALQHARSDGQQVRLTQYNPDALDESVLWSLSDDIDGGYKAVRNAKNTAQNLDAWKADNEHGGVRDGTLVTLYKWNKGPNQLWKIESV